MITVLQPDPKVDIDRFGPWLQDAGQQLHTVRLWEDELPSLEDCGDGIIVLGGTMNAVDESASPWLAPVKELLRQAVAKDVPVLGICLGHQILAEALGGTVTVNHPEQGEDGPFSITLTEAGRTDSLMKHLPEQPVVAESHYDVVERLPEGATLLASSQRCPNQAFRAGSAVSVQFHPEVSPETMGRWFALGGGDEQALVRRMQAVDSEVIASGNILAFSFAAGLR